MKWLKADRLIKHYIIPAELTELSFDVFDLLRVWTELDRCSRAFNRETAAMREKAKVQIRSITSGEVQRHVLYPIVVNIHDGV